MPSMKSCDYRDKKNECACFWWNFQSWTSCLPTSQGNLSVLSFSSRLLRLSAAKPFSGTFTPPSTSGSVTAMQGGLSWARPSAAAPKLNLWCAWLWCAWLWCSWLWCAWSYERLYTWCQSLSFAFLAVRSWRIKKKTKAKRKEREERIAL